MLYGRKGLCYVEHGVRQGNKEYGGCGYIPERGDEGFLRTNEFDC